MKPVSSGVAVRRQARKACGVVRTWLTDIQGLFRHVSHVRDVPCSRLRPERTVGAYAAHRRTVHLRVRVGKNRAQIAAALGWHPDTYRGWELTGRAEDKMSGEPAWGSDPDRPDRGRWAPAPFFDRGVLQRGAMVDGDWRPPMYGPYQYGNPHHFTAFEVPAERLRQALQRTREDREAQLGELLRG